MLVPPTLKLFTQDVHSNTPSIQELWVNLLTQIVWDWEDLSSRCPKLQVFRLERRRELGDSESEHLLSPLRARKENSDRRFEVDSIQMEPLKKLVIPFDKFSAADLEECRELVGEVVDLESEPEFWDVEI